MPARRDRAFLPHLVDDVQEDVEDLRTTGNFQVCDRLVILRALAVFPARFACLDVLEHGKQLRLGELVIHLEPNAALAHALNLLLTVRGGNVQHLFEMALHSVCIFRRGGAQDRGVVLGRKPLRYHGCALSNASLQIPNSLPVHARGLEEAHVCETSGKPLFFREFHLFAHCRVRLP